ncbi:MAG: hypothetical protein WBD09_11585 [Halobacteriota archaeon]
MKKKENVEVMLIAETNWLESIALAQDSAAAYLLDLADSKKIEIAVPEYLIYEADGSLNRKLIKRAEKIDDALSLLGQIAQTTHYAKLCEKGREILKELKKLTLDDRTEIKILAFLELIKEEYDSVIFYTADKEDFDHSKIHEDLRNLGVEFMFDSGTCVERVER